MITDRIDKKSGALVLKVKGDVLSTKATILTEGFEKILESYASTDWKALRLDLMTAKMVDSTGLNVLLGLVRMVKESGKEMSIVICMPAVKRVLEFSHFDKMVTIVYKEKKKKA